MSRRLFLLGLLAGAAGRARGEPATRIRMAVNGRFAPLVLWDGAGQWSGLLVDELRLAAETAGVVFDFVDRPWARGQQMVRAGELDGFCTIPTAERRDYVLFAPTPLFAEQTVLVGRADDARIEQARTLDDIKALKFAEPRGTGWTRGYIDEDRVVWCSDINNILSMIEAGRADAGFFGRTGAESALARFPRAERLRLVAFPAMPPDEGYCFGLRKTFPDAEALVARIDGAVRSRLAAGAFDPVRSRYLRS